MDNPHLTNSQTRFPHAPMEWTSPHLQGSVMRLSSSLALPMPQGDNHVQSQHTGAPQRSLRHSPGATCRQSLAHPNPGMSRQRETWEGREKWFPYHRLPGADKTSSCYRV